MGCVIGDLRWVRKLAQPTLTDLMTSRFQITATKVSGSMMSKTDL